MAFSGCKRTSVSVGLAKALGRDEVLAIPDVSWGWEKGEEGFRGCTGSGSIHVGFGEATSKRGEKWAQCRVGANLQGEGFLCSSTSCPHGDPGQNSTRAAPRGAGPGPGASPHSRAVTRRCDGQGHHHGWHHGWHSPRRGQPTLSHGVSGGLVGATRPHEELQEQHHSQDGF